MLFPAVSPTQHWYAIIPMTKEVGMKNLFWIMIFTFGLSGCATMESAWDSTKEASSDAYEWVAGDSGKDSEK